MLPEDEIREMREEILELKGELQDAKNELQEAYKRIGELEEAEGLSGIPQDERDALGSFLERLSAGGSSEPTRYESLYLQRTLDALRGL